MATTTNEITKKDRFEKSSKRAALYTLIGVLLVAGALVFSFYRLYQLDSEIAQKQKLSTELDQKLQDKQRELDYREQQVKDKQEELARAQLALEKILPAVPKPALEQTIQSDPQIKLAIEEVKTAPYMRPTNTKDEATAAAREREGFQALINGDYDHAIAAFQTAENAYNGYHHVYELAVLLRRSKAQLNDPAKKKEVFQTIVKRYSYGAPPDLWAKVVSIANQ